MSQSKLIILYGKNATEISPGTYQTNLDTRDLSNVNAIALKTTTFMNLQYNIFADGNQKNNTLSYEIAGAPFTYEIPISGYYTTTEVLNLVIAGVQAQLDINSPGDVFSSVIGQYHERVEFLNTGVATMKYNGETGNLNDILGNPIQSDVIVANTVFICSQFADLRGLKSVTISIKSKSPKTILNKTNLKPIHTNSIGVVPVTVGFKSLQTYTNPDIAGSSVHFSSSESLTQIQFKIRNDAGYVISNVKDSLVIEIAVWF